MRTTEGRSACATAENADDSTRASFGASVFGVTGPPVVAASAGDRRAVQPARPGPPAARGRSAGDAGNPTLTGEPTASRQIRSRLATPGYLTRIGSTSTREPPTYPIRPTDAPFS